MSGGENAHNFKNNYSIEVTILFAFLDFIKIQSDDICNESDLKARKSAGGNCKR